MSTRAIAFLKKKGVPFEVVKYTHLEKGAAFAAAAINFPLARTIKTLVVQLGRGQFAFVLMPGDRQLNLKRLARGFGVKRTAMVDSATAERLTGYLVGGISPFGARQRLPAVIEAALLPHERVVINAGQRGTLLQMAPADIVRALNCRSAAISGDEPAQAAPL
jgi:Cys-tRNA(Pro)/Cys-tRNA(Cys) deacylase